MTHLPGALAGVGALVLALSLGITLASLGSAALITTILASWDTRCGRS